MKKLFFFFAAMLVAITVNAQTDFAAPGYKCAADDAVLSGTAGSEKLYLDETKTPHEVVFSDISISKTAVASWTVTATRGCYVSVALEMGSFIGSSNSHIFDVKIIDSNKVERGQLSQKSTHTGSLTTETFDGTILLPTAGVYTVEIHHNRDWCKGSIQNVVLTYAADAPSEIVEVESVELNKTELALDLQEVEQLTATVSPDNATDPTVTWESTDESVATVDGGFITAIKAGTTTIKAKAGEKEATCAVTVAAATIPEVKLTSTYTLAAKVAHLEGKVWKKYDDEKYKIYGDGGHNEKYGNALWTINVTNPCIISASVMDLGGGALYELDVFQGEDSITTVIQPETSKWWSGVVDMTGTMTLSKAGEYTFRLRNTLKWSSGKTSGIMLSYESALPQPLYLKPGIWNVDGAKFAIWDITHSAWSEFMTPVENEIGIYTATIAGDAAEVIFVRLNNSATAPDWDKKDNQTGDLNLEDGKDLLTITDWGTGTWSLFEPTPWVTGSNEKLKVFKEGDEPGVVSVQQPGWAAESGIYMTFPSAAWDKEKFSLPESKYATEGAGMVIYLSALDLKYNEITVNCQNTDYAFTIYNADGAETVYNVAGSSAIAFGTTWDTYANKMTLDEDLYKWEKTELELAAGNITFKVVKDHVWAKGAWPASDYVLNIPESGIYTISITFNESTKEINATATKTGEAVVLPVIKLHGNFSGSWVDSEAFAEALDKKSASLTIAINKGDYAFGVKKDGSWYANGSEFTRENPSAVIASNTDNNMALDADKDGDYTFIWTFETNTLYVDYPGCHWNELEWITSSDASYSNQFKVCVGDPAPGIDNIQKPGFANEIGIYMTFPSAVWDKTKFSLPESKYAIQGAGMVLYLSAFSAKETEVTIGCDNKTFEFTVYNDKGTVTPTAIDNTNANAKAVKSIVNGQLLITRDGKTYNVLGTIVK